MSDLEEAVKRLKRGDSSAFEEIVNATSARLVRLCARMLGNVSDAEDVVQDVYLKAHRALINGEFDQRSRVETWLYRIAINKAIDAKRKRKRKREDELVGEITSDAASAEAVIALRELSDWLGELPEAEQTVLMLKAIEGMSSQEIAEILGCSEGAVEQRLVRARTRLRERRGERDG